MAATSGYDRSNISVRMVTVITVGSIIGLAILFIWARSFFNSTKEQPVNEQVLQPKSQILEDLRKREDLILNSFRVLDSAGTVYQIPIDRAMDLVVDEYNKDQESAHQRP